MLIRYGRLALAVASFVAFGAAALLLEVAFEEGWVGRFR
jgi:hypothetical protein